MDKDLIKKEIFNEPCYFETSIANGWSISKGWYVRITNTENKYLHTDGVIRNTTLNRESGNYTGYFETKEKAYQAIKDYYKQFKEKTEKEEFPKFEDVKKMTLVPTKCLKFLFDKSKVSIDFDKFDESVTKQYYKHFKSAYNKGMFVTWSLKENYLEPKEAIKMMLDGKDLEDDDGNVYRFDKDSFIMILKDEKEDFNIKIEQVTYFDKLKARK